MEQNFQYVAQKVMHNKKSDSLAVHFAKHFTQKLIPQKCRDIMFFKIFFYSKSY